MLQEKLLSEFTLAELKQKCSELDEKILSCKKSESHILENPQIRCFIITVDHVRKFAADYKQEKEEIEAEILWREQSQNRLGTGQELQSSVISSVAGFFPSVPASAPLSGHDQSINQPGRAGL